MTPAFAKVSAEKAPTDLTWAEKFPALLLLAALLAIGFWPKCLSTPVDTAITATFRK